MKTPTPDEYGAFYAGYVREAPEGEIIQALTGQLEAFIRLLESIDEEKAEYRYAPGKWSIKQVLGHVVDTERLFSFRAMHIARGDTQPLPGMDQDAYVQNTDFSRRTLKSLIEEFRHLRLANILLFQSFDDEVAVRRGTASDTGFTAQALVYIVAGHAQHHYHQLRVRYLG